MSDKTEDGGPAFPSQADMYEGKTQGAVRGMALRDYFAARAMQGELSAMSNTGDVPGLSTDISDEGLVGLAVHWYRIADAMLAARGKR